MKRTNLESSRWKVINNLVVGMVALWGFANFNYQVERSTMFEKVLIETFSPIQRGTRSLKESFTYFIDHYFLLVETSKKNVELTKKIQELESEINFLSEVRKENERLKNLLDFGKDISRKKTLAQVVGWDSSSSFKVLRINKGSNSGLKVQSPVVTTTGLVGYIYRVTPNYSDVLTILDPNNRVDVLVTRTRSHGILEGRSDFLCSLKYISRTEKLEVGDDVITAGMGNIYPKGIAIGKIARIDKESYGITQKIQIEPFVDFKKLEEVAVLQEEVVVGDKSGQ